MKRMVFLVLVCMLLVSVPVVSLAWTCTNCNRNNTDSAKYCVYCGYAHSTAGCCPYCLAQVTSGTNYCTKCGKYLSNSGTSSTFSWPSMNIQKVSVNVKGVEKESDRRQSFAGPGSKSYIGAGGYKPYKIRQTIAWFAEDNYVLVELHYKTVQKRLVYFQKSSLQGTGGVQSVVLSGHYATLIQSYAPQFGPGSDWDTYQEKDVHLYGGETITGFFQMNGYVFCEFTAVTGELARGCKL